MMISDNIKLEDYEENENIVILCDGSDIYVSNGWSRKLEINCFNINGSDFTDYVGQLFLDRTFHKLVPIEPYHLFYDTLIDVIKEFGLDKPEEVKK